MQLSEIDLDHKKLEQYLKKYTSIYSENTPFPHIVIDNFFDPKILDTILSEFPDKNSKFWKYYENENEIKLESKSESYLGVHTKYFLSLLNSSTFINFLEALTGIRNLIPDPHFEGGGLHQILPGGKLGVHADFNLHEFTQLERRINVLVYLNKDWKDEYNGHLELWDNGMEKCYHRVAPLFNRVVIFNTTSVSMHGHPDELLCPEGMSRKSLALYYYTNGRPEEELNDKHYTLFRTRPNDLIQDSKSKQIKK